VAERRLGGLQSPLGRHPDQVRAIRHERAAAANDADQANGIDGLFWAGPDAPREAPESGDVEEDGPEDGRDSELN
jgi:hypothetical protein